MKRARYYDALYLFFAVQTLEIRNAELETKKKLKMEVLKERQLFLIWRSETRTTNIALTMKSTTDIEHRIHFRILTHRVWIKWMSRNKIESVSSDVSIWWKNHQLSKKVCIENEIFGIYYSVFFRTRSHMDFKLDAPNVHI